MKSWATDMTESEAEVATMIVIGEEIGVIVEVN